MREILFRGKTYDGKWVQGSLIKREIGCFIVDKNNQCALRKATENLFDFESTLVIPKSVGQYTGLTDKNGTKIFEGDIVEICFLGRTTRHLVEFDDEYRCGWFPFACGDGCGCCETDTYSPSDGEVIGNIHDNPELLKGGASDA